MLAPQHPTRGVIGGIALAATVGLAACSAPTAPPDPTVDFHANGGTSVGMPGMSPMPAMSMSPQASSAAPTDPVAGTAVSITNFAFTPATLKVKPGETVTWTNHDEEPHTVVAENNSFHSPGLDSNATYTFTFTTPGSFDYICSIHPFMHGTVVVAP